MKPKPRTPVCGDIGWGAQRNETSHIKDRLRDLAKALFGATTSEMQEQDLAKIDNNKNPASVHHNRN